MVSIIEALGEDYKNIKLQDNESPYGGISFMGETLNNFMCECDIAPDDDFGELCVALEQCGIMSVRPMKFVNMEEY